jgi:hypothetical protein
MAGWHLVMRRFVLAAGFAFIAGASQAADIAETAGPKQLPENAGVVCTLDDPFMRAATAATLPWQSVWLGHFSGGRPYKDDLGRTLIDWRDEKVCFASQSVCRAWLKAMRRYYPDPQGWVTCMLLR